MSANAIREAPIDQLLADPDNPRVIAPEALDGLEHSLGDFGDLAGIVFNQRTKQLVTGHQRVTALKRAGATVFQQTDNVHWLIKHPKTGELFPVRVVDWAPEDQRIANLVANSPSIAGEFTPAALEQLKALEDHALFEALRLDELQRQLMADSPEPDVPEDGQTDPDNVPEPPVFPTTQPGDLWIMGDHRVLCGDATKAVDVERLMGAERASLCATDPPYGVNFTDKGGKNIAADMDYGVIPGFFGVAVDFMQPGRAMLFFGAETNMSLYGALANRELRMRPKLLFWKKSQFVLRHHDYHSQFECIYYCWTQGGDAHTRWQGGRDQSDVWEIPHDVSSVNKEHPTQKPVALFEKAMLNHTRPGEICYEPFSGSGSQVLAGERTGRKVYALEIDPQFTDVTVRRWEAFTGRKAERQPPEPPY